MRARRAVLLGVGRRRGQLLTRASNRGLETGRVGCRRGPGQEAGHGQGVRRRGGGERGPGKRHGHGVLDGARAVLLITGLLGGRGLALLLIRRLDVVLGTVTVGSQPLGSVRAVGMVLAVVCGVILRGVVLLGRAMAAVAPTARGLGNWLLLLAHCVM